MKRGMNSNEMQKNNRILVFRTLLENGSMTRTELALHTGLQKATITNIINEFFELDIVAVEGEMASGRRGEKIYLKLDGIYTMSIGINRKDYKVGIYSLEGKLQETVCYRFEKREEIQKVLEKMKKDLLILQEKYGKKSIIGICLAVPGLFIHRQNGGEERFQVSEFEQLGQINIRKELEETLGMPVEIKHDAKLSAFAEWKNAEEAKADENVSLIVLHSKGFGIGAGLVINKKIVEGQVGIAGEVGHIGINYNGRRSEKGHAGSFEYCAGTESAVRYMKERLYEFPESVLHEESTYSDIVEAYKEKDPLAVWAMEKMAWMLGYGIANIVYLINPDCIILGADYPELDCFIAKVKETVREFVSEDVAECISIRYTKLNDDAFLLGGYYHILETMYKDNKMLDAIRSAIATD